MIHFPCPYCRTALSVPPRDAGAVVRCPLCGRELVAPAAEEQTTIPRAPGAERPVPALRLSRRTLALAAAGSAALVLLAFCAGVGYRVWARFRVYDRQDFDRAVIGLDPDQVRGLLGPPDQVVSGGGAPLGAVMSSAQYSDAIQAGGAGEFAWIYLSRARDPKTYRKYRDSMLVFERGRVRLVVHSPYLERP
jgi:hypothetical protein